MTTTLSLKLFHGRSHPGEQLDDWGFDGPCLGPLSGVHLTYGNVGVFGPEAERIALPTVDDLLFYGGAYFGDASIDVASVQPPNTQVDERLTLVPKSLQSSERAAIHVPERLWGDYLRRVEVFVDSIRELVGDTAADSAGRALSQVMPIPRSSSEKRGKPVTP